MARLVIHWFSLFFTWCIQIRHSILLACLLFTFDYTLFLFVVRECISYYLYSIKVKLWFLKTTAATDRSSVSDASFQLFPLKVVTFAVDQCSSSPPLLSCYESIVSQQHPPPILIRVYCFPLAIPNHQPPTPRLHHLSPKLYTPTMTTVLADKALLLAIFNWAWPIRQLSWTRWFTFTLTSSV